MYPEYMNLQGNRRSGTLYKELIKLQQENQQLKKQKHDAIKFLKSIEMDKTDKYIPLRDYKEFGILLRMLGEKDVED